MLALRLAPFSGVHQDETLVVEERLFPLGRGMEDLVAQARIDGEPVVDLEVVLHECALLDDPEVRTSSRNPRLALLSYPRSTAARPVPPAFVTGLLTKLVPKLMALRVLS